MIRTNAVAVFTTALTTLASLAGAPDAVAQGLLPARDLSVELALDAATAALGNCAAQGYRIAVAVADRSGQVRVLLRGDGAGPHGGDAARLKAYTAASSGAPTLAWAENLRRGAPPPEPGLVHLPGILAIGGGVPIRAGDQLVGAIGVAGAPSGERDDACAKAGIASVAERLR